MIDEELKIWAAGLFDGEGSALIERTGKNSYSIVVAITGTNIDIHQRFRQNWGGRTDTKSGGYLSEHMGDGSPRMRCYWTYLNHAEAKEFLADIYPYLVIKGEEVKIVLQALLVLPPQVGIRKRVPRGTTLLLEPFYREQQTLRANRSK